MSVGQDLLNVPFPEMVKNLGIGIAEAQFEMDKVSVKIARFMSGFDEDGKEDNGRLIQLKSGGPKYSLLAMGFTPTFYQFVDTTIELKMAISMKREQEIGVKAKVRSWVASVNASYSQKYQYSAEGSSTMRTKLVTVPPPAVFEELIRNTLNAEPDDD